MALLPLPQTAPSQRRWHAIAKRDLEIGMLWFTMAVSGFVLFEPAPFEFMVIALIGVWLLTGLHIPRSLSLLVALLGVLSATGLLAATLSTTMVVSARHVVISIFLYALTLGLAAFVARDPRNTLPVIMSGYIFAAVAACIAGILGYFNVIGLAHDLFVHFERARGTLKDPNVFGPFLVVPIVYIYVRHLVGEERIGGLQSAILAILGFGILLSFSRGAWANLVFSAGLSTYLLFVSARSNSLRLKVIGLTVCIAVLSIIMLMIALSFDAIASLMSVRGQLIQSYDTIERFAGAQIALDLILKYPLGIGSGSFNEFHEAEPHNVFLYSFLIGGWIGGFAYLCLVISTIYVALRAVLVENPLRLFSIVLFSTFLAVAVEGLVIDTDHWRHFYIIMACIWGVHAYNTRNPSMADQTLARTSRMLVPSRLTNRTVARSRDAIVSQRSLETIAQSIDVTFNPAPDVRSTWRRRLGQVKTRTPLEHAPVHEVTPAARALVNVPPAEPNASIVINGRDSHRSVTDRTVFGLRRGEDFASRATFGRRT